MNAISGVDFGFSVQLGNMNYDSVKNLNKSEPPATQGPNSFLSILNLLDVNADEKIDTQELKFGAGFMMNTFLSTQDQDGNLLLSAKEAGVSSGLVAHLDTDGDEMLSAKEMITATNKIIDGLVPLLDTDGDKALSREELAIFELLFGSGASAVSKPKPDYASVEQALDMNTIPDRMRQAGFQGRDSLLYYVLASSYADLPWQPNAEDPDSMVLSEQRGEIKEWFDKIVMDVAKKLEANPTQTTTAIINDGPDRCGFRLGPAIKERLKEFGDRVQMGEIYTEG